MMLWEMMTHEVPYKGVDTSAIIWGVGSNSLSLPIPASCPDGFKLLMKLCWFVVNNTNNSNSHDSVYGAVIVAVPLCEFTEFIS